MKDKEYLPIALLVAVLMFSSLACGFSAPAAKITNAHMATDASNTTQTMAYSPDAPTFYCFYDLNNAPDSTVMKGVWTLVSAEGFEANSKIDSAEITGGDDLYYFTLDRSAESWPVGQYKIDLFIDDKLVETVEFQVQ